MNKTDYKKIEYYLYNYSNIDKLIDEIKDGLINSVNVSGSAWRKGITVCNNTLENQVIKIIENKKILKKSVQKLDIDPICNNSNNGNCRR